MKNSKQDTRAISVLILLGLNHLKLNMRIEQIFIYLLIVPLQKMKSLVLVLSNLEQLKDRVTILEKIIQHRIITLKILTQ